MTARTHDLAALTALGFVAALTATGSMNVKTALVAMLANQLGGITPDIDQPTAPLWHNLPSGRFFGRFFAKLLGGHRFLSHSLLGVVVFGFLAKLILAFLHPSIPSLNQDIVWWAYIIGLLSHLLMDSFTKEGIPLLLPIPYKFGFPPLKALRITTGKFGEKVLFVGLLLTDIVICLVHVEAIKTFLHQIS